MTGERPLSDAGRLATSQRCSVVVPAGGGKTELIVRAVKHLLRPRKKQLVLTHTHAGVSAIRARLKRLGVPASSCQVTTIDGFAKLYASHYPLLAGLEIDTKDELSWDKIREGARRVSGSAHIGRVLTNSYAGVLVDEYQDCSPLQHNLVLALAHHLPTRVVGDPLQGIFGFANSEIVDWKQDVTAQFPRLEVADVGWRWKDSNPRLGHELADVRARLLAGEPIDPRCYRAIRWFEISPEQQRSSCHAAANSHTEVVAIHKWANQCHELARRLGGRFSSMDELAGKDLIKFCAVMDTARGAQRAAEVISFARKCITRLPQGLAAAQKTFREGRLPRTNPGRKNVEVYRMLVAVADESHWRCVLEAMAAIESLQDIFVHRRDCWFEGRRAINLLLTEAKIPDLRTAALRIRDRTRRIGRSHQPRTVSRTLLVKGLEYEHAVVLDADALEDPRELYVALTRGRFAVTVLSATPILQRSPVVLSR